MDVPLNTIFPHSFVLFDGGLGTTLEDVFGLKISQLPLWSAQPIVDNAEVVLQAHMMFLHAGARLVSSATYQCSVDGFQSLGFNAEESKAFMLRLVRVAHDAVSRFYAEIRKDQQESSERAYIALSLGPFGATLKPTQEFNGIYPPPYGPKQFIDQGGNVNSFNGDEIRERHAIDALAEFHFNRLAVFAMDNGAWDTVDCLAFETIPLSREVKAIRKALGWLQDRILVREGRPPKPWWISCVFPNGESPEETFPGGPKLQINDLLNAAFAVDKFTGSAIPSGFGINCTAVKYLPLLTGQVRQYFKRFEQGHQPWLILYPNGNATYDETKQTWVGKEQEEQSWAEEVNEVIQSVLEDEIKEGKVFGGIVIGGCCRTTPGDICALRDLIKI